MKHREGSRDEPIDLERLREELANADGPRYWRSLDELAQTEEFEEFLSQEFPRWSPIWEQTVDRRTVLKTMAASMALAGLTACGRDQPPEDIVPYVNMPENMVPGLPRFYATAMSIGGYAHGVLAQSREGRPVKIEGNPDSVSTRGACDQWSQASLLSLYDPDRAQTVLHAGEVSDIQSFLGALEPKREQWDAGGGRGLCLLTDTLTSPSELARIEAVRERWPEMRWFVHDPAASKAAVEGARLAFGQALEPRYHFDRARVICALDADFLASMPGFLHYARDFAHAREVDEETPEMVRLYAIESTPSITGAAADHRASVSGDRMSGAVLALARALGVEVKGKEPSPVDPAWIEALAEDLRAHGERAVVVPGPHLDPALHAVVYAINDRLRAPGRTVVYQKPVGAHGAESLTALARAIDEGSVDTLIMMDNNPVYTAPADLDFAKRLQQVTWRVHWGPYENETARYAHWHVHATHPLEAWADLRAFEGTAHLVQPLIEPLHGGYTALQMWHVLTHGVVENPRQLLYRYWQGRRRRGEEKGSDASFALRWQHWLRKGVVPDTAAQVVEARLRDGWAERLPAIAPAAADGLVLQLQTDHSVLDGRYANNGWLQELPRPLTKLTWNNAALVSPALAERHGLRRSDVVRLTVGSRSLDVPVYILPGQPENAVTLNLGYGRDYAGAVGTGVGVNAYLLRRSDAPWVVPNLAMTPLGEHRMLATTQDHNAMEGRDLIRSADLETFRKYPEFAQREPPDVSLYPEPWPRGKPAEQQWGMSIDMNVCIGCNACVIACQAENNIPIVGEDEVWRGHEMHWLRVDRYFEGEVSAPRMVFQPVPCMHCENAPCEYVCPVEATQHSADGLNEMIYQRCVGTRYCSQNCPYKVRSFNWFNYTGPTAQYRTPPPAQNPDVTIRTRGVMEKCTYCVQRINAAKIRAAKTDESIADGEIVTACQQACPTQAIVFGDIADESTEVSREKAKPRDYDLLGDLNTRPRTSYLAAIRNPNPAILELERKHRGEGHG